MASELRELRLARGLALGTAASRAGVAHSTVIAWEGGTGRPRGAGFERLLTVLGVDARQRARLLHEADPAHARIALAGTPLGAPVDVGRVIRAMRLRRGTTQAELARAVGVAQSTVAGWELGDATPTGETVHAVAFALGAAPEEACARGASSGALPDVPYSDWGAINHGLGTYLELATPPALREVVGLGLEAELWPRAARNPRWDATLAYVMGKTAGCHFGQVRLGEAKATARRAMRLELRPQDRNAQAGAFSALLEVATYGGADPSALAGRIEAWTEGLPDRMLKGWMMWEQALRLAETGRPDEAVELTQRSFEIMQPSPDPLETRVAQAGALLEVEIRAGRADRAEAHLPDYLAIHSRDDVARRCVRIFHARREAADEATMAAARTEYVGTQHDNWDQRLKMARVEHRQARFVAARR